MKMTDMHGDSIQEGDLVAYQVGTKFEAIFTLRKDKRGTLRFHFPDGDGYDMEGCSRSSAWHESSDSKISRIIG
jgi:hypothetical protein